VDDYVPQAKTLAQILNLKGFLARTANSGLEALQILEEHLVDILLTDVRMPGMTGLELYQAIKKFHLPLTAILMSGEVTEELLQQGMADGVYAVLDKPVDIPFLLALISTIKVSLPVAG